MSTPYTEGRLAGYRDEPPSANPYLKGLSAGIGHVANDAMPWAMEWIRGYIEGLKQAHDDVIDKHREGTR